MKPEPVLIEARQDDMRQRGLWRSETINDYLDDCVRTAPEREALVDHNSLTGKSTRLNWGELTRRVDNIAQSLCEMGVRPGDVVSYQLPNWWEFTALYLSCARIGAIANPVMPIFRERELTFMLGLAESKVLIVPRSFRGHDYPGMIAGIRAQLPALEQVRIVDGQREEAFETLWQTPDRKPDPALRPDADAVTQVLYTSGTTGEPKGVMHTSNTLLSNLREYVKWLQLGESDVVLMASPMAHQTGFMYGLMMPVLLRAKTVLLDIWNAQQAAELIAGQGVTFTMASAPFLNDLTEAVASGAPQTDSLRVFLSAGAPIPRALVAKARDTLGAAIVSAWGMTENGVVTLTRLNDPSDKVDSTDGCCLTGLDIKVVDGSGHPAAPGEEGELMVRGCSQFAGYLKRPELNATDAEGWFNSGDLARMTEDGYIRISGRSKDVIIRGGENIPVVEVENLLFRHPSIAAVSVVGYPDPRLGERAVAFVVLRPGQQLGFNDMVQFLAQHQLTRQYFPERLEIVDELPRTPSGKVQKFKLRDMARSFGSAASA